MVCYVPSKFELRFESGNVMFSCISEIRMTLWNLFGVMWSDVFRVVKSGLEIIVWFGFYWRYRFGDLSAWVGKECESEHEKYEIAERVMCKAYLLFDYR